MAKANTSAAPTKASARTRAKSQAAKVGDQAAAPAAIQQENVDWTPTPEAKQQATRLRLIAAGLWALAIITELVCIFWLLRQKQDTVMVRLPDSGLLEQQGGGIEQWAFITLLVLLGVIAALAITGSLLWKKANRLDPARKSDTVRYFVQNQLGAIIAILAFLPLVILILTNKNMNKNQKAIAGGLAVLLGAVTVALGIDLRPPSVEQYTADRSAVIQLLGSDTVFWVSDGSVYHVCQQVSAIQTGSAIQQGTTAQAVQAGKIRLTLQFPAELRACGRAVPQNSAEITAALKQIQEGKTNTVLPAPVWAKPEDAPIKIPDAPR